MTPTVHKNFRINGISFKDISALFDFSKGVSPEIHSFFIEFLNKKELIALQTSGSSGGPKIIEIKKVYLLNSARATGDFFDLKEDTTALLCMNPKYVGAKMMLVRAMLLGWHLDIVDPSLNPLKEIKKNYDFCAMVPLQVFHSLEELNKIKKLIIGGGLVSSELQNSLQEITTQCFSTYGMTETVSHIAISSLRGGTTRQSHYKILPNISISTDNRNCLVINAPKIASEEIVTNDIVEIISDSEFKWLGRYDNIINSGGIKLIPEQIERKLSDIIKDRFFISSVPDPVLGKKVVLVVEFRNNLELISTPFQLRSMNTLNDQKNVISKAVRNLHSLSKYEIPKDIYFIPKFIETETKKIQRKKTLKLLF